jgi:hypothetical protein
MQATSDSARTLANFKVRYLGLQGGEKSVPGNNKSPAGRQGN